MMKLRNLFLSMILCLGSCAVASAQSLSGPLSFRFDVQGSPFTTLTPGPGIEFSGPSPLGNTRPWNWVVDIDNLQVTATATLTSASEFTFLPILSLEGAVTIPGYTITGVTFNNTLPSGSFITSDISSTEPLRPISFQASVDSFGDPLPNGTQIVYRATFQVTPNPVPEPSTCALLGCGVVALGGYVVRRRRRA